MLDVHDPAAVLALLPRILPPSATLNSPQDAISVLVHGAMTALAFRLIGTEDDGTISHFTNNVLPNNWNEHGPGHYTLRYRHEQSSLEFVVKISKLAARTVINAIAVESDKAATLDIQTSDFTSESFFPHNPSEARERALVHGFISSNRIADFMNSFKLKIIQKLVPGLRKEGYTEITEEATLPQGSSQPRPRAPREPSPPYGGHEPFGAHPGDFRSGNPLSIGRQDLDPLPAHHNPFGPPPLFGGPSRGDGMFVGPNHPIFSERFTPRRGDGLNGREGPWGGDGFLPPMGAPPGARFDPIGPHGTPFGQGGGGPFGGPAGGNRPRGSGIHGPDNDEFMPPGMGDMFS